MSPFFYVPLFFLVCFSFVSHHFTSLLVPWFVIFFFFHLSDCFHTVTFPFCLSFCRSTSPPPLSSWLPLIFHFSFINPITFMYFIVHIQEISGEYVGGVKLGFFPLVCSFFHFKSFHVVPSVAPFSYLCVMFLFV